MKQQVNLGNWSPPLPANERRLVQKLRYRYRLYPHPHHKAALAKAFGCARVVWNDSLVLSNRLHQQGQQFPRGTALQRLCLTDAQRTPERAWLTLTEVSNVLLAHSIRDLDKAFRSRWGCLGGKAPTAPMDNGKAVGIGLGLAALAVTSDGEKIAPPKFLHSALKRLGRLQRSLGYKVKGPSNRRKVRLRVAKAHATLADQRLDVLHKLSRPIIRENQAVVRENPDVSGMLKNCRRARSTGDAGGTLLRSVLESKAEQDGGQLAGVNRWLPTSQTCSACGHRDGRKELSVRFWKCSSGGAEYDRDLNSARNSLAAGPAARSSACGTERKAGSPASGLEAGTRLNQEVQRCTA